MNEHCRKEKNSPTIYLVMKKKHTFNVFIFGEFNNVSKDKKKAIISKWFEPSNVSSEVACSVDIKINRQSPCG